MGDTDTVTLDLGSGRSAQLRPAKLIPNRVRRAAVDAHTESAKYGSLHASWAAFDVVLAWMVESWTLGLELPSVDVTVLEELDVEASNRLYKHCTDTVMGLMSGSDLGSPLDEASPTDASSVSLER